MAKKYGKEEKKLDYVAELKALKAQGPGNLYLMYGPEDYLREQFLTELKKLCLPDGEDGFSFKRFDGPELEPAELEQAIDAVPFMTERSFVELRDVNINKLGDPEHFVKIISDIPDYCTVAFVQSSSFEPDNRLKFMKALREKAHCMDFVQQSQGQLFSWINRRFEALGKSIDMEAIQRLIFVSGDLMNHLIPEIEKIAAYVKDSRVTAADVEAVAHHIPDADVFAITDSISQKNYEKAFGILAELLGDKGNEPIMILAVLGAQMRKLYAAKVATEQGVSIAELSKGLNIKFEFIARNLVGSAKGYTVRQLAKAVELCAEADSLMKTGAVDSREYLKELVVRIAAGE